MKLLFAINFLQSRRLEAGDFISFDGLGRVEEGNFHFLARVGGHRKQISSYLQLQQVEEH